MPVSLRNLGNKWFNKPELAVEVEVPNLKTEASVAAQKTV